ncbi:MAG: prefoldin subunit beta [Euryarchaeota archaeon]|nr:prefoldin subunit beta [Euryarchaeota archaeon]
MMEQIPPQLQHQLAQFQQLQQQAEAIATQRLQMELQLKEVSRALEEVQKLGDDAEVYRSVGNLLIKSAKDDVESELKDRKETLELRINTLKRQEEKVTSRLKELQAKIQEAIRSRAGGSPGVGAG